MKRNQLRANASAAGTGGSSEPSGPSAVELTIQPAQASSEPTGIPPPG
jgi:hypothetical protein